MNLQKLSTCLRKMINEWFGRSFFDQLSQQQATRLNAYFIRIKTTHPDHPLIPLIQQKLDELQQNADWDAVKAIELLLVPLLDSDDLNIELLYQLHHAQFFLPDYEHDFFQDQLKSSIQPTHSPQPDTNTEDLESHKRALLTKLLVCMQKFHEDRKLRSIFANKARFKIGLFFGVSILSSIFLLAIGILHPQGIYQYCSNYCPSFTWLRSITGDIQNPTDAQQIDKIQLHFAITALMAGFMGACFSMLISLKSRIEVITLKELENLHKLHFILTRIITGIGAALICYYFFRAQLITGSIFPDFTKAEEINLHSKTYFTLIIWCFIAGFSEKLVPSILSKTEEQLAEKS